MNVTKAWLNELLLNLIYFKSLPRNGVKVIVYSSKASTETFGTIVIIINVSASHIINVNTDVALFGLLHILTPNYNISSVTLHSTSIFDHSHKSSFLHPWCVPCC